MSLKEKLAELQGAFDTVKEKNAGKNVPPKEAQEIKDFYLNDQSELAKQAIQIATDVIQLLKRSAEGASEQEIGQKANMILGAILARLENVQQLEAVGIPISDELRIFQGLVSELIEPLSGIVDITPAFIAQQAPEQQGPEAVERLAGGTPRNDWEKYMYEKGAGYLLRREIDPSLSDDEIRERFTQVYADLRSIFHSALIRMDDAQQSFVLRTLAFQDSTTIKITVQGTSLAYSAKDIIAQMDSGFDDNDRIARIQKSVATEFRKKIASDFSVLNVLHDKVENFSVNGKATTLEGIREFYNSTSPSWIDQWFWDCLADLPAFANEKEDGTWQVESTTMADKIFSAFQQILIRGRRADINSNTVKTDSVPFKEVSLKGKIPEKAKQGWRRLPNKLWEAKALLFRNVSERALFPWKTSTKFEKTLLEEQQVQKSVSEKKNDPDYSPKDSDPNAEWAMMQALSLSEILLEGASQDAQNGAPNGFRAIDQLMNATQYGYKALNGEEDVTVDRYYNVGMIGSFKKFFLPFLDFFGYDGKTLTEHLIRANSWKDIRWDQLPKTASRDWSKSIEDACDLAKIALKGFSAGDLTKIGQVNLEKNIVSNVNKAYIAEFLKFYRIITGYQTERDSMPWPTPKCVDTSNQSNRENPTGQFREYVLIDKRPGAVINDPKVKEKQRFFSRIHHMYYIEPQDMLRWIQKDEADLSKDLTSYMDASGRIVIEYYSSPKKNLSLYHLLYRELVYKYLMAASYEGDVIKQLGKEDILLFGMVMSVEIREKFINRYYNGPIQHNAVRFVSWMSEHVAKFLKTEIPNIDSINLFTADGFEEMLHLMGYEYRVEDLIASGQSLLSIAAGKK